MELKYKVKKWNQAHSKLYPFETKCFLTFLLLNKAYSSYFNNLKYSDTVQKPESYIISYFIWSYTKEGDKFWRKLSVLWLADLAECRKKRKNKEKCLI